MSDYKSKVILNKKAKYEYHFLQEFEAGVVLVGTEVKAVKAGDVNLSDAYCMFVNGILHIKSMYIGEYKFGNVNNHETRRDRRLLLKKSELKKLEKKTKEKGFSIVPYKLYFSERGFIKIQVILAQGKKAYDKRQSIKDRDVKRDMEKAQKYMD